MVYAFTIDQNSFQPARFASVASLVNIVLPLMIAGGAILFLVFAFYSGFQIMTNGDNPDAIKKAQQSLGFSLLGLIFVVLAFFLVRLIGAVLHVDNILPL